MTFTIELAPETVARLQEEATKEGVDATDLVRRLIEQALPDSPSDPPAEAQALFAQWDAEDATDDPKEIEARNREWEELQAALDEDRTSYRKLFK